MRSLFESLKPRQQRILVLRYNHGLTFAEIAISMHVVESAVFRAHHRILQKLRDELMRRHIESPDDF